ncbi:MAG: ATP-grasp domain-containing protein [Chloroflexi bacterium]|nr:ATP-grasp domain-containing protein [Chloroflexota bacterium]MCL5275427.1 ATP-grasp domain-containing protein [Chloroflexota bacterium]
MQVLKKMHRAQVLLLYNYYKSWTPAEVEYGKKLTAQMVAALEAVGHTVRTVEFWRDARAALHGYNPAEWIIFNWCEGVEGEVGGDARICAELDQMGFTYTGNTPATLKMSVEKGRVKRMLQRWHIPTPAGQEFTTAADVTAWEYFPAIVKPVSQHCSVGVTHDAVVHDIEALRRRVAFVNEAYKEAALVEQFIPGREINVGVWGNGRPRILPLREIDFSQINDPMHQLVTFDSKWSPDSTEWRCMPVITEVKTSTALRSRIMDIALNTYRVFECRDYARVDLRIDAHEQPYVVDVNPNPDITSDGGFIGACMAAGYTYGEAVSAIVMMAVARRNRRQALFNTLEQRRQSAMMVAAQEA